MDTHSCQEEEEVSESDEGTPEKEKLNPILSLDGLEEQAGDGSSSKRKQFAKRSKNMFSKHVYVKNETNQTIFVLLSAIQVQLSDTNRGGEVGVPLLSFKFERAKTWDYSASKTTAIAILPEEDFRLSLPAGADKGKAFLSCYYQKEGQNVLLFKDFVVKKGYKYTVDRHRLSFPLGCAQVKFAQLQ